MARSLPIRFYCFPFYCNIIVSPRNKPSTSQQTNTPQPTHIKLQVLYRPPNAAHATASSNGEPGTQQSQRFRSATSIGTVKRALEDQTRLRPVHQKWSLSKKDGGRQFGQARLDDLVRDLNQKYTNPGKTLADYGLQPGNTYSFEVGFHSSLIEPAHVCVCVVSRLTSLGRGLKKGCLV